MRVQRSAACHTAAFSVVLILATPLFPQGVRQSTLDPNSSGQREMQAREWALTHVPDEVNRHFKKEQVSLFAQIREDFTRLQLINNEMMQRVFVKGNVDHKLIATSIAEINKRAARLKETLVLPEVDHKTRYEKSDGVPNNDHLQAMLLALDASITSFVSNPIFKQPNVVDAELALKARRDLDLIIKVSEQLKSSFGNETKNFR